MDRVVLPQVYTELTSRMVMTMEWVEGARLSDRAMLDTYGLEPSRLVDTMVRIGGERCSLFVEPSAFCLLSVWRFCKGTCGNSIAQLSHVELQVSLQSLLIPASLV